MGRIVGGKIQAKMLPNGIEKELTAFELVFAKLLQFLNRKWKNIPNYGKK